MAGSYRVTSASTFVVRFWREWSAAGPRWRGCIEHIQSDESADFLDLEAMVGFIRSHGIMANDEGQPEDAGAQPPAIAPLR